MRKCIAITVVFLILNNCLLAQTNPVQDRRICLLVNDSLTEITAQYNTKTGDTTVLVGGIAKPFRSVYPIGKEYAVSHDWYKSGEAVIYNGRTYKKDGWSRLYGLTEFKKSGSYKGINVYMQPNRFDYIFLPVRQGCEFAPYVTILSAKEYLAQGKRQGSAKNYWDAVKSFNKCIELAPDSADCYIFRGTAYGMIADKEASEADFAKALRLTNNPAQVYMARGIMFVQTSNREAAIADFKEILKLQPNNSAAKAALKRLGIEIQ